MTGLRKRTTAAPTDADKGGAPLDGSVVINQVKGPAKHSKRKADEPGRWDSHELSLPPVFPIKDRLVAELQECELVSDLQRTQHRTHLTMLLMPVS